MRSSGVRDLVLCFSSGAVAFWSCMAAGVRTAGFPLVGKDREGLVLGRLGGRNTRGSGVRGEDMNCMVASDGVDGYLGGGRWCCDGLLSVHGFRFVEEASRSQDLSRAAVVHMRMVLSCAGASHNISPPPNAASRGNKIPRGWICVARGMGLWRRRGFRQ